MELTWTPEPADWSDGFRAVLPFYRWVPVFAAALAIASVVLLVLGQAPGWFGLGCALIIAVLGPVSTLAAFRRDPIAGREVSATLDERPGGPVMTMMTADGTARSEVPFGALDGWAETERSFLLRTGGTGFHVVPGRGFGSTEDIDRFRALLTDTLGPPGLD